jgi:outer membrane protein assembly factor BamD
MKSKVLVLALLITAFTCQPASAYWIWTPKTGKWINPKHAAKSTPKEQFDYAKSFYDAKKYQDAEREFKKLIKAYGKTREAAESQYFLGLIQEEQGRFYEAYQAYQKVIDKYPFFEKIQEVIGREYNIAELFMSGEKRKALGIQLPVENPAIEILSKVVENSTYGPLASKAQYKLGLVLKELGRNYEAEEAFNKVLTNYPDSEWSEPAKFQIASVRSLTSRGSDYDQGAAKEAKEKFEEFVKEYPDAVLSKKAEESIGQLKEKEAESHYNIGRFYEKQQAFDSAKIYYEDVISNSPHSPWAVKALERLRVIETRKGKK